MSNPEEFSDPEDVIVDIDTEDPVEEEPHSIPENVSPDEERPIADLDELTEEEAHELDLP